MSEYVFVTATDGVKALDRIREETSARTTDDNSRLRQALVAIEGVAMLHGGEDEAGWRDILRIARNAIGPIPEVEP